MAFYLRRYGIYFLHMLNLEPGLNPELSADRERPLLTLDASRLRWPNCCSEWVLDLLWLHIQQRFSIDKQTSSRKIMEKKYCNEFWEWISSKPQIDPFVGCRQNCIDLCQRWEEKKLTYKTNAIWGKES